MHSSPFIPRENGGGGPPEGRWRGRGPQRNSFDESEALSQMPPPPPYARFARCGRSPSPAIAGAERISSRSRGAFFVRVRVLPSHCTKAAPTKIRGAERREARSQPPHRLSDENIRTRGQCGARHECFALPRTSACGRARLSALRRGTRQLLHWLSFGLRFPVICSSLRYCRPLY